MNSHSAYRTAHSGSTNDSIGRVNVNGESVLPGSYQLQIRQELLLPIQLLIEKLIGFPAEAVNLAKMINGLILCFTPESGRLILLSCMREILFKVKRWYLPRDM